MRGPQGRRRRERVRLTDRETARRLATESLAAGDPLGWFERLYAADGATIPWADLLPNPHLVGVCDWPPGRALVVGCGLGDDAAWLAERGWQVTAFDISPSGIEQARARFPERTIDWCAADLFDAPQQWDRAFDLVVEIYTLQVLPPELQQRVDLARWVAPGGRLLVIARGRDAEVARGQLPWPLTADEVRACGRDLDLARLDDFVDDEAPPVRRLLAVFHRP